MNIKRLKKEVYLANLSLVKHGLVLFTWGNVSAIDRNQGLVAIKPSGVSYERLKASDIVVLDLNGNIIQGSLAPSSDTPTHLELYKAFEHLGGIAHTHSSYAAAWAQSGFDIPVLGTTHADYFYGDIPCVRQPDFEEVATDYEKNTGKIIAEAMKGTNPMAIPAVLVKSHGIFSFGTGADNAVYNAVICEEVAKIAYITKNINPRVERTKQYLLDKHFSRKHGKGAYYGQIKK